ncbi:MAG: 3-dehydroquinate synthase [Thermodesulfovibrionales bacterium]|nr:3-dehydroquinate synthase [Thermodesulfovibrionales bacterium]
MVKVKVELGNRSYDILINTGILSKIGEFLLSFNFSSKVVVISNPTVFGIYGDIIMKSLKQAEFDASYILIPDGEEYKDYFWCYHIITQLLQKGLDRKSCLIALGGGVIGDITGFVASIYMRGISHIQVPTTLLAQVDSSVGGKTGVNHYLGKNMIGTFYQPRMVVIDISTLKSLSKREFFSGLSEVIKYGVIWDLHLFEYLEKNLEKISDLSDSYLFNIIKRSCEIKADIVSKDERESGLRAILNFGHTIGHAIETETEYKRFLHGEAVSIGMCLEAEISQRLGLLDIDASKRIKSLIASSTLPFQLPDGVSFSKLKLHIKIDKKKEADKIKFILPIEIGKVMIKEVKLEEFLDIYEKKSSCC